MAFFNKLKKKKSLTVRIDPLLKFSSKKNMGEIKLGKEKGSQPAVYSELPTLARVQREGSAENWRAPLPAGGRFAARAE